MFLINMHRNMLYTFCSTQPSLVSPTIVVLITVLTECPDILEDITGLGIVSAPFRAGNSSQTSCLEDVKFVPPGSEDLSTVLDGMPHPFQFTGGWFVWGLFVLPFVAFAGYLLFVSLRYALYAIFFSIPLALLRCCFPGRFPKPPMPFVPPPFIPPVVGQALGSSRNNSTAALPQYIAPTPLSPPLPIGIVSFNIAQVGVGAPSIPPVVSVYNNGPQTSMTSLSSLYTTTDSYVGRSSPARASNTLSEGDSCEAEIPAPDNTDNSPTGLSQDTLSGETTGAAIVPLPISYSR